MSGGHIQHCGTSRPEAAAAAGRRGCTCTRSAGRCPYRCHPYGESLWRILTAAVGPRAGGGGGRLRGAAELPEPQSGRAGEKSPRLLTAAHSCVHSCSQLAACGPCVQVPAVRCEHSCELTRSLDCGRTAGGASRWVERRPLQAAASAWPARCPLLDFPPPLPDLPAASPPPSHCLPSTSPPPSHCLSLTSPLPPTASAPAPAGGWVWPFYESAPKFFGADSGAARPGDMSSATLPRPSPPSPSPLLKRLPKEAEGGRRTGGQSDGCSRGSIGGVAMAGHRDCVGIGQSCLQVLCALKEMR